jgi:hypothetical protein
LPERAIDQFGADAHCVGAAPYAAAH